MKRKTSAAKSNNSSTLSEMLAWKPRLSLLIGGFITACAVTVGVLGWQLTMAAGKDNVASMIEEIEFLISNQISNYVIGAADSLTAVAKMQQTFFQEDVWSFSTPERAKATYKSMLIALKAVKQYTSSMYMQTYPEGCQFGYFYHTDSNGTETLRWWSQVNNTVTINLCTPDGTIIQPPIDVDTQAGNGTLENPGANNTLQNAVGGIQGADLQYSVGDTFGYSNVYLWNNMVYKSAFAYSINKVTGEHVTFGNDWTLEVVGDAILGMLGVVSFPMFAAVIEANTGYLLASSTDADEFLGDDLLEINLINDPFLQDFSRLINSTFQWNGISKPINSLPSQLLNLFEFLNEYYTGSAAAFIDRKINGKNWKLGLNSYTIVGNPMLFITYMDIDSVEEELNAMSAKTGYMMIGIIAAFVIVGAAFTIVITRQLSTVSRQIKLLKDLKFKEVLGVDAEIKDRSFIYELAELQKCFYSMVLVFSELLKSNSSIRNPTQQTGSAGPVATVPRTTRPMSMTDPTRSGGAPKEETTATRKSSVGKN